MILDGYENPIKEVLEADTILMNLLSGGLEAVRDLGISGAGFTSIIAAHRNTTTGIIKPFGFVRGRTVVTTSRRLHDEESQYTSIEQVVEVWIMDDPTATLDTINLATDRVYELLQFRPPTGAFQCELDNYFDARDYDFNGARAMSLEFRITAAIQPSS